MSEKNRSARGCKCAEQAKWGYQAFFWKVRRWIRKGKPQKTPGDALLQVSRCKTVLITCRGCGSESLREYP